MGIEVVTGVIEADVINKNNSYLDSEKRDVRDKLGVTDLSQEVLDGMTGGAVANVGLQSVDEPKIIDATISPQKTTFFEVGKNMFDPSDPTIQVNKGYSGVTNAIVTNAISNISGEIKAYENNRISISKNGIEITNLEYYKVASFDDKGSWISTQMYTTGGITLPSKTVTIKIHYDNKNNQMQIEKGNVTPFESYYIPKFVKGLLGENDVTPTNTTFFDYSKNLFNRADPTIQVNMGYSGTTSTIVPTDNYNISGRILGSPGDQVLISQNGVEVTNVEFYKVIEFDSKETWLSTKLYVLGGIRLSQNTVSYKIHYDNKNVELQVETDKVTDYHPYIKKAIKKEFLPETKENNVLSPKFFTWYGDSLTFRNMWQRFVISWFNLLKYTNLGIGSTTLAYVAAHETQFPSGVNTTRIQAIKDSLAEVLTIAFGANDAHRGVPIGDLSQLSLPLIEKDKTTFIGAYSFLIETLLEWKPTLEILIITLPQAQGMYIYNYESYAKATVEVANYYGLSVADWYHKSGVNKMNLNQYTIDGLHQNEAGGKKAANVVIEELSKIRFL